MKISRRSFLKAIGGAGLALAFPGLVQGSRPTPLSIIIQHGARPSDPLNLITSFAWKTYGSDGHQYGDWIEFNNDFMDTPNFITHVSETLKDHIKDSMQDYPALAGIQRPSMERIRSEIMKSLKT